MVARIVTEFRHSEVIKGNSVQILLGCESCQNMQISKWNGKICKFPALAERTGDKPYYQSSQCHWTSAFHSSLSIIESLFALWPNLPSICWRPGRTCYYFGRSKFCPRITVVPIQYLLSIVIRHIKLVHTNNSWDATIIMWVLNLISDQWSGSYSGEFMSTKYLKAIYVVNGFCRLHPAAGDLYSLLNCPVA